MNYVFKSIRTIKRNMASDLVLAPRGLEKVFDRPRVFQKKSIFTYVNWFKYKQFSYLILYCILLNDHMYLVV